MSQRVADTQSSAQEQRALSDTNKDEENGIQILRLNQELEAKVFS